MKHLDTSFFVDILREGRRGEQRRALELLASLADEPLGASVFAACELMAGAALSDRPREERERVERLLQEIEIAYPDDRFAARYAELLASLTRAGARIAGMDLLIATSALVDEAVLVTRNPRHFDRVPGLRVVAY